MKYLFCVTSALTIDYGKYSYDERLHQLVDSIRSIKQYAPNSDIALFDVSINPIPEFDLELLKSLCIDVIEVRKHPLIKIVAEMENKGDHDDPKRMLKKSIGELANIDAFVYFATERKHKYTRVFKLTGRYRLNEMFTKIDYLKDAKDKICCLSMTTWDRKILPMRLWSFDTSMCDKMAILITEMLEKTNNDNGTFNIIEWTFLHCIEQLNIPLHTVPVIGCEGNMFDGHFVKE